MSLNDFIENEGFISDNYDKFCKLKEKFLKEGLPERLAVYKAISLLNPEKLEKINILAQKNFDSVGITFFFDKKEHLELMTKYFNISFNTMHVKDSKLLIKLLELLNETKVN